MEDVQRLIEKASDATDGGEAMRFSQAALNAANAIRISRDIRPLPEKGDWAPSSTARMSVTETAT